MAYDPNWPRWVQASLAKYLKDVADTNGYASLVEELEERTTDFIESTQRLEIRMNGPFTRQLSANFYLMDVDVNVLIFSHMDGTMDNVYGGIDMAGIMAQAISDPIPVFKYGNGIGDDQSQIGCLTLRDGPREGVKVLHFGEIDRVSRLRQMGVDASLKLEISS